MSAEPTKAELEAFIQRAGFTYGWANLESWARRMAEQAVEELKQSKPLNNEAAFDQLLHDPRELAQQDADAFGIGFIVDGQRVVTHRVQVFVPAAKATGTAGGLPAMPEPDLTTLGNRQFFTPEQMREYGQQCAEAARQPAPAAQPYRHIKSGKLYELLHIGALEADLTVSAIYRCTQTGQVWVRPMTEFTEKFELAATNRSQP